MNNVSITIKDQGVLKLFTQLSDRIKKPDAALAEIGEAGTAAIRNVFKNEGSPSGSWPKLKQATINDRIRLGKWPGKILQRSGVLINSISYQTIGAKVVWGSNVFYAATHQYGYTKQNIPARPFMVFEKESILNFKNILRRFLSLK